MKFEYDVRVRHTDFAGVVFFGRWFEIAHDAYEDLMGALGVPLAAKDLHEGRVLPIVRAEADYTAPIAFGERVGVEVEVEKVGGRSFTLGYRFVGPDGTARGRARTVHVAVDPARGRAVALPAAVRSALSAAGNRRE